MYIYIYSDETSEIDPSHIYTYIYTYTYINIHVYICIYSRLVVSDGEGVNSDTVEDSVVC